MTPSADLSWIEVDDYVARFECAWTSGSVPELRGFLTPPEHPQARNVLVELIRVDLEYRFERGIETSLNDYLSDFPECTSDAEALNAIAFEDYRLRRQAGEPCTARDYKIRYGCDIDAWPQSEIAAASDGRALSTFVEIQNRENQATFEFPEAGAFFAGFELIRELGRGAFSRVFLAKQGELAGRSVVVKISTLGFVESERLARLQHSHIVPVYSVHHKGRFSVVCMPYFGESTLADLLEAVQAFGSFPATADLVEETARRKPRANHDRVDLPPAPSNERCPKKSPHDFVTAVLRLATLTAEALAFAHHRGILHRDLKPANILLSEDCNPMLLDFNLSDDLEFGGGTDAMIGGTLPYMAPEQLAAYVGRRRSRDRRSDLFSFGIVFYELLTGRHPLPLRRKVTAEAAAATESREWPTVTPVHKVNPAATPAVSAILSRCLEYRPEDRYPDAAALVEDLQRQLSDRPLRYARDTSVKERVGKWMRRHPRLLSAAGVTLIAAFIVVALSSALLLRSRHLAALTAETARRDFASGFQKLQAKSVCLDGADVEAYRELVRDGRSLLDGLQVWSRKDWWNDEMHRDVSTEQSQRLRTDVGEVLLLMTAATQSRIVAESDVESRRRLEADAQDWLARSKSAYGDASAPRALSLLESMPVDPAARTELIDELHGSGDDLDSLRDSGLAATILLLQHRPREALPHWQRICRVDPGRLWGQFGLGYCYEQLKQWPHAISCYSACIALDRNLTDVYFRRGICHLKAKEFEFAKADFDIVLSRSPDRRDALLNRATTSIALERYADASGDLESLLERSPEDTRAQLMAATVCERQGKPAEARRRRLAVITREIKDPDTLVARGVGQVTASPQRSLEDFAAALLLDASHLAALESKAHVLSEKLGDTAAALETLNLAVSLYPEESTLRAGRGVLLARSGKREAALSDARKALELDASEAIRYQVAGIHAILGSEDPAERKVAIGLLAGALRRGYGLELLDDDPDLANLRLRPEFSALKSAAAMLDEADSRNNRGR